MESRQRNLVVYLPALAAVEVNHLAAAAEEEDRLEEDRLENHPAAEVNHPVDQPNLNLRVLLGAVVAHLAETDHPEEVVIRLHLHQKTARMLALRQLLYKLHLRHSEMCGTKLNRRRQTKSRYHKYLRLLLLFVLGSSP